MFTTPKPTRAIETTKRKEPRATRRPAQLQDGRRGAKELHVEKKADEKVASRRNKQTIGTHLAPSPVQHANEKKSANFQSAE